MGVRMGGWVYIMTNRPNGTLYVGVTSNLASRAFQHPHNPNWDDLYDKLNR